VKAQEALFGEQVWSKLIARPLGSMTKRELELIFLQSAVDCGLLKARAESVAETCNIPITRAHGYLTDLALRQPAVTDPEGIKELVELLRASEIVLNESHFSIPLHDAALRIWLERKMTRLRLNSGDTLRRDHVKLTPAGLAKIIDSVEGIVSPFEALKCLPPELQDADWVKTAKKSWKKSMGWKEALGLLGSSTTIVQAVLPMIFLLS
jgi:hypothetical protein